MNQEIKNSGVTQVILLGDAGFNTSSEVSDKRSGHNSEKYWANSKFGAATTTDEQLPTIIAQNIPIHAFYIKDCDGKLRAKNDFEYIASRTGGKSRELNIASNEGAEQLTAVVAMNILQEIGQKAGGATMADQLRNN